ncbi:MULTISPECIES: sigma-54 interaction domain-containing protein [Aliivibrio]|uniref:Sigma-54-dependent Fis family transcriptional regulator n=1 Tax=Aliivibrio finisterrensis TaxID=511998 RepID=A0A4Q5KVC0_9GAMM|nr:MULTISPECIES: sigma-54 dependent transcriptional regulator [Aliivibrio]MDD9179295.1 sigma-54 dependent transcriptional regulator [Aliivibrio sp. A6]RYU51131.1 sigma-54-dependent Fis family transcriptional regulator [Aliivibrio finisterrensis]RYU55517.1 sigma-54-dependent Fis family transcriptional regulator [Aliivibrio finisterrensis]RYU60385.1 sigma-54-dependent Fis family transcriptional regulator [Aliivibrio finisterrensis]RYU64144.1 sigma-54-dependent Fis family transcriptional regulato
MSDQGEFTQCWLSGVLKHSGAQKVICFLSQASGTQLFKMAEGFTQDNGNSKIKLTAIEQNQHTNKRINTDYSEFNTLTLCMNEGRNFNLHFSQCSDEIKDILFDHTEHYSLTDGEVEFMPLRNAQGRVSGVLMFYFSRFTCYQKSDRQTINTLNSLAIDRLAFALKNQHHSLEEKLSPQSQSAHIPSDLNIIGESQAIKNVRLTISKALHINRNVLVTGETGSGKELIAKAIHQFGNRRNEPYVVQNCASIPEHLLESELFGYQKGAFTGADRDYIGLIRSADKGILFLDEIGDMPSSLQAKLLRVLEEKKVRPLGSTTLYDVDVKVISATHQALLNKIEQGEFRQDLYFRLAQFPIALPPLREREKDIALLGRFFAEHYAKEQHQTSPTLSKGFIDSLSNYSFPGNVRELKNIIERCCMEAPNSKQLDKEIITQVLNGIMIIAPKKEEPLLMGSLSEQIEQFEKNVLMQYLEKHQGHLQTVANRLELSKGSLDYRLRKFNLSAKEWRY